MERVTHGKETRHDPDAIRLHRHDQAFEGVTAVDDSRLAVPDGSIYGFIGPNGSGKTTTLRMIMHILLPDQGAIEVLGSRATRPPPATASATCLKSAASTRR